MPRAPTSWKLVEEDVQSASESELYSYYPGVTAEPDSRIITIQLPVPAVCLNSSKINDGN